MPKHRTVLGAGATGMLGMRAVQQLVADEYDVIGLTRSQVKRTLLEGFGARAAIANILDAAALEQVLRQTAPTAVIHLFTAFPRTGPLRPSQLEATNHLRVMGTTNSVCSDVEHGRHDPTRRVARSQRGGVSIVCGHGAGTIDR